MPENLLKDVVLGVGDFVALVNQTFEFAYPSVTIRGELANFRVSKNKWVYFDLKDESATVRFFGTVFQLNGPLEDGMLLRVRGTPKLHPQYGFSVNVQSLQPEGEGTIKRAAELLQSKLEAEGLFALERKRLLPYPPQRVGLIASSESAAYVDFMKILNARWSGIDIQCVDVQVQGEIAPAQIAAAIEYFNQLAEPPEVLVITRGGGSAEDLYAFSTEQVTRAVAASRVPTLVAIGHEIDISLAELAADQRASTPSNAAELLVPDRKEVRQQLRHIDDRLHEAVLATVKSGRLDLGHVQMSLDRAVEDVIRRARDNVGKYDLLLRALDPHAVLRRGYAVVRLDGKAIARSSDVESGAIVNVEVSDGRFDAQVQ